MIFDYVISNTSDWYYSFWNDQIQYENWLLMHRDACEWVRLQRLKLEELQSKLLSLSTGCTLKVLVRKSDPRWSSERWKSKT